MLRGGAIGCGGALPASQGLWVRGEVEGHGTLTYAALRGLLLGTAVIDLCSIGGSDTIIWQLQESP